MRVDEDGWGLTALFVALIVVCVLCVVYGFTLRKEDRQLQSDPAMRSLYDNPERVGGVWIIGGSIGAFACMLGLVFVLIRFLQPA
ncbi:hypothetical protein D3C87_1844810 [compost metagenome]